MMLQYIHIPTPLRSSLAPSRPHANRAARAPAKRLRASSSAADDTSNKRQTQGLITWLPRPLDPRLLEYAVCDVLAILALYEHFRAAGYVDRFKSEASRGSATYAAIYQQIPYQRSNPYQNHPLLPFGVLPRLSPQASKQAPKRQCSSCLRELSSACFSKGKRLCYVCGCIKRRIKWGRK